MWLTMSLVDKFDGVVVLLVLLDALSEIGQGIRFWNPLVVQTACHLEVVSLLQYKVAHGNS